jgi:hypothetical protein
MTQINRVDQAILLLKERLRKLGEGKVGGARTGATAAQADSENRLAPIRQLARQGDIAEQDLRRAFVRTLLADSLGENLAAGLEFQAIADQVTRMLEDSESGRNLLDRALAELN